MAGDNLAFVPSVLQARAFVRMVESDVDAGMRRLAEFVEAEGMTPAEDEATAPRTPPVFLIAGRRYY